MSPHQSTSASVGVFVLTLLTAAAAHPQSAAPATPQTHADNYYAAGEHIAIAAPMGGDVIVAGRQVDIAQPVAGDILVGGWSVVLSGRADDDVRIAAGTISVDAPVGGDLTLAGGDVTIGPQSEVRGRSWITGRTVRIDGIFDRELKVAGGTVQIGGEIRKPLQVVAERLEILSAARVLAPLTYKSPAEARIAEGATLSGPITYTRISERDARRERAFPAVSTLLFTVHLLLAGLLALIFLPRFESSMVDTLRAHPAKSALAGFVMFVTVPIAALLLMISVLGLPLGLALGALYAMALFVSVVITAFFVGDVEARLLKAGPIATRGQHALLLLAGVLTLALLRSLLGGLIVFASILFGLGALTLWGVKSYSHTLAASPA